MQGALYSGGGTQADPYIINTPAKMNDIGANPGDWGSYFLLTADIDLGGYTRTEFNIIGNTGTPFTGVFDGNGHTISNFTYNSTGTDYIALFGYVDDPNAEIKNLGLIDPNVDAGDYVGSLVGTLENGAITDCNLVGGSVSGHSSVGGLVGRNVYGTVSNSYSTGDVNGFATVGGLVGRNYSGMVSDSYATGSVSGDWDVGGLVGWNDSGTVNNSYSTGSVSGDGTVGGLVGQNNNGTVSDSYATGDVNGTWTSVGGLVGENNGTISNCYAAGSVSGNGLVGGLVGENDFGAVSSSYSTGSVSGDGAVGGLVGQNGSGTVSNSYSVGDVNGVTNVGGLVGRNGSGTVSNSYSVGDVNGVTNVGGLVGTSIGHVVSCFWDVNSSGQMNSAGGTGKTTAEMKDPNTFIGWWCNPVWTIDEGVDYPRLVWENAPGELITNPDPIGRYGGGSGKANDPYLIYTAEQLNTVGLIVCDWDKYFKLMVDTDLGGFTGTSFNIIGSTGTPFTGVFDGNDHTISNLTYSSSRTYYVGLFGYVDDASAEIKNVGLIDPNIDAGAGDYVGSLVGRLKNGSATDCNSVGGNVSGNSFVGGLVGENGAWVSNSYATVEVSKTGAGGTSTYVGGLVGRNDSGTVSNSYATGSVSGEWFVGGLVGYNYIGGTVSNSYATGSVSGDSWAGGLVGYNWQGTVSNSYATGDVNGTWKSVGGLMGRNDSGTVSNSYATGSVSGGWYVGGLVGFDNSGNYTKSFWDNTVNPLLPGIGNTTDPNVIGESTANMQISSTFTDAGWDFVDEINNGVQDIWRLCNEGAEYPQLNWQFLLGDFVCPDGVETNDLAVLVEQWLLEKLSADVAPDGGDGFVDFLDWAVFANGWQSTTDINDLAVFIEQWLQQGASSADIAPIPDGDSVVNLLDFAVLADNWLMGVE